MGHRAYNFNAGPAALPLEVLKQAQEQFVDYEGIGMSVMEISHRSKEYEQINEEAQQIIKQLLNVPEGYRILFLQGGASTQFAMLPMNFLGKGRTAGYVHTGSWADKAIKEARRFGEVAIAATAEDNQFTRVPDAGEIQFSNDWAYLHMTANETIGGIEFQAFPDTGDLPLVVDMSSDIMSRQIDVSRFAMIYAGAQKNLGPSGVTLVIIREDWVRDIPEHVPTMLRYDTHVKNNSLYNTPPVYSVYMMNLMLKWVRAQGGLAVVEERNRKKAGLIYEEIDQSEGFYQGVSDRACRSLMNITFRMANEQLEKKFIEESEAAGFVGLKGHRSVGGLRASAYNAVPYEACSALQTFMHTFRQKNG